MISTENFENWKFTLGIITGSITTLIAIFLHLQAYKTAIIKFKQTHLNERFIYIIDSSIFSVFILSFFLGSSIGLFLLPLLFVKDFSPRTFFLALCIIFALYEFIILYTSFYILSDKQICFFNPYKKFKNSIKNNILYSKIQEVGYEKTSGVERLVIKLKNGEINNKIIGYAKLKEAKAIIEGKIERQG